MQCGVEVGCGGLWAACVGVRQQLPPLHTPYVCMCVCVYTPVPCLLPPSRICSLIATGRLIVYLNNCLPPGSCRAERLFPPLQPPIALHMVEMFSMGTPAAHTASGEGPIAGCQLPALTPHISLWIL